MMGGSHFVSEIGTSYYVLEDFAAEIEAEISSGSHEQRTVNHFCDALRVIKIAYTYLRAIDYYLDMDEGEDTFNDRLPGRLTSVVNKGELKTALEALKNGWISS